MQETNQLFSVPGWENTKKTELKKNTKILCGALAVLRRFENQCR